jgi:sugar phosphate permease
MLKHERKGGWLAWFIWSAAVIFYLYEYMVRVAPAAMERELAIEFAATSATMAAALGAYYFVYAPLQLFAGVLFDRLGGRIVLVPAAILVAIGCLVPAIPSTSLFYVTAGRIMAGIGSSCAFIGTMYLAAIWFHDNRLAFLSGLTTSLGICGALLAQVPLARLINNTGWKMSMMLIGIGGIFVAVLLMACIPQTPRWEREKMAVRDRALSFWAFLSGLASVCKNKQTWLIGLVASCLYMPTVVFGDLWGIRYIESVLGLPKTAAAKVTGMLYIGWLVGSPLAGLLSDAIKCRRLLLIIGCIFSTILFLIMLLCPIKSATVIGILLFLAGICSSPQVVCFVASLEVNTSRAKGSAIAVINMIVMLVGGLFQPIVGRLIDINSAQGALGPISHEAFRTALLTIPLLTFIGFILSFFIKKGININY